jgi:hypothetical protein
MPNHFQTYTPIVVPSAVEDCPRKSMPSGASPASRSARFTGPLAGSKTNCMTTPTIAVVVTTGRNRAVLNNLRSGMRGELSTIAISRVASTWIGTATSMNASVSRKEFQNIGSARTSW